MREYIAVIAFSVRALMLALVASCAVSDAPVDETAAVASALDLTFTIYDGNTQCNVSGNTMHCCPLGFAMIGAQVDRNVFKCAMLNSGFAGARFADFSTQRNNMHACPFGAVMVGLHASRNVLTCQWLQEPFSTLPSSRVLFEYVDGPAPNLTVDSFPMHVCQDTFAMAGIHVGKNLFTCDS